MEKESLLLTLILFLSFSKTMAQSGKLISADNELSNSLIYQVYQDKRDVIWVATEDGLNRYDGAKFTIYKHNPADTLSLGHNFARVLFEDSNGHFFIGLCKGLQLYDYATDSFRDIPMFTYRDEIVRPHVTSIIERRNGDILIGTSGEGIYQIDRKNKTLTARQINEIVPSIFVIFLYEDKENNLWISTEDKGLYLYTPDSKLIGFSRQDDIVLHNITSICEDTYENLLVGSLTKGVYGFNRETLSFYSVPYPGDPALPVKTFYADRTSGGIYIGTDGKGIKVYDPETRQIGDCELNVTIFDLDKSKVHTFMKDKGDNIWMGIYQKGVLFLPAQHYKFNYIGYKSVVRNNIGSNCILSLLEDREGILWVGTDNDGLYGIAPGGKQYAHFLPSGNVNDIPGTIMSIYEDSNRDLWVGSYLNGMAKVNKRTGVCQYVTGLTDEEGKPVERIFALMEDRDKQLWIGTMGHGLFSMDLNTGKVSNRNVMNTGRPCCTGDSLANYWIDCLFLSGDNKLYIGTYDGLSCLDLETNSYLSAFGVPALFTGLIVYALYEDKNGNMWAGTSEGLICIDKESGESVAYTMADGLASNVICAVKGDEEDCLWVSTHYGISKFDVRTSSFINYYASDGLQGNEFGKNAAIVNSKGQMVFGGINGITWFNPGEITFQPKKIDVRITDFYIHDKVIKKGSKSGKYTIIDTSVSEAENFRLSHTDNSFSIEFSVMNFSNPERILNLINQLMDIRKIDKGIMTLKFQEVDIIAFMKELYTYYEYHAQTKQITFGLHTEIESLPVWIDPGHFDKIILNVLSNAFKYTPENGKVDIYLTDIKKENEYHRVSRYLEIVISDNGIGIQGEDKNRIFERFYQVRNHYNNSSISTGIGLHLAYSLVKLHHGTIWAEDNPEGGSRFIIHVPLGCGHLLPEEMEDNPELIRSYPAERKEMEIADTGTKKGKSRIRKHIIIAEDDEDIRRYICNELADEYHMLECNNGKEAYAAILKKAPDLVISDIMMPEMDGITLCRKIKQNIHVNHVPVVLLTARSGEDDNLEGLSTGADAYIMKPFHMELVKKTIENIIRTRELLRNSYTGNQQQQDKVDKIQLKSADEKLLEKVMRVINDNISNPDLSVEMIAGQVGISRVHLHRKLKELTNQTTRDLIRNVRLKQAADLLAHKKLSVSEVANATGFSNLAYFSNSFKDLYGVSPTHWAEEQHK
ncbi:MAG: response regulator [Tannerellaceae bacterium]|nr:response regulator [Tannerellaceae bacterium]